MQQFSLIDEFIIDSVKALYFTGILITLGYILDKVLIKNINTIGELKKNNIAVAIVYAGFFVAISIVLNGRI